MKTALMAIMPNSLVSVWDSCFVIARDMFFGNVIPPSVKLDIKPDDFSNAIQSVFKFLIQEEDFSDVEVIDTKKLKEDLLPLQKWLSDQAIKDIERGVLKADHISRTLEGDIDPRRTIVSDIFEWAEGRTIPKDNAYDELLLINHYALSAIHDRTWLMSQYVQKMIYDSDEGLFTDDLGLLSEENADLIYENQRLTEEKARLIYENQRLLQEIENSDQPDDMRKDTWALKREPILGAAVYMMAKYPDQCRNSSGKYEATKIAVTIDEKALLFWPTGEPPMKRGQMERLISKWLHFKPKDDVE